MKSLAAASEEEVLKYWQGLGYYSRARNLHAAARSMKGGKFPGSYEEVQALKGVGDYTAAAICSLAYGMPYAVVDGNVYRVLARYFGIDAPIDSGKGKKLFAGLADEMLDKKRPAEYNQAIMDFGALQCVPRDPACNVCPLAESCAARAEGKVAQLPVKQHKTQTVNRYFNYLYVRMGEDILLHKRTGDDIWKNLYELPLIEADHDMQETELLASGAFRALFAEGETPLVRVMQRGVKHVLSHRVIYADLSECYHALHQEAKSRQYLQKAYALRDSTFLEENMSQLSYFSAKYGMKEKELMITRLEQAQLEERAKALERRIFLGIVISALLFVLFLLLYARQRQKVKIARLAQAAGEKEQQFLTLQKETERRLTQRYIEGLESERTRIATELHDDVCNSLLALSMDVRTSEVAASGRLDRQLDLLEKARQRVRHISHELMPPVFQYATLNEMLSDYVNHLQKKGYTDVCIHQHGAMVRVLFRGFETEADARKKMQTLQGIPDFQGAWILELK